MTALSCSTRRAGSAFSSAINAAVGNRKSGEGHLVLYTVSTSNECVDPALLKEKRGLDPTRSQYKNDAKDGEGAVP